MNQVSGKVLLKETNVGIPNLLVEIYDIDPGVRPDEIFKDNPSSHDPNGLPIRRFARLVTGLTADRPNVGSFDIKFEDTDFQRRNSKLQRPNLLLVVRAPEDEGAGNNTNVLYISNVRQDAETTSVYVIRIPTAKLQAAGINPPTGLELDMDEPQAVIQKIKLGVERHVETRNQVQQVAKLLVETERARTAEVEKKVEARLIEKLTGVPADRAEELNFTPPGADVEKSMYDALQRSIDNKLNQKPDAKGYVVLSKEQAEKFKVKGKFRENISPEEIAPFLFGSGADSNQRPAFLVRESPAARLPAQLPPELFPAEPSIHCAQSRIDQRGQERGLIGAVWGDFCWRD